MKLAVYLTNNGKGAGEIVEKMCRAQRLKENHSYQIINLEYGAIGYVKTSDQFSAVPHVLQSSNGNLLAISGVPHDMNGSLKQTLLSIVEQDYQHASRSLSDLDGAFAAVFWDNAHRKLVIVTDFLGNQPLYKVADNQSILLATDIRGITASGLVDMEIDPCGWGSFLSLGYFIANHTSLKKVRMMEPGSITIFDPVNKAISVQDYWNWSEPKRDLKLKDVDTGLLVDHMDRHVKACLEHNQQGTLLLSGGFDSRFILCVLRHAGIEPKIAICEHPDEDNNADGRYARQVAELFKLEAEIINPAKDFYFSDGYVDYMVMNEVTSPSLNLFIAQLAANFKPDMQAIWEGVGPGNSLYPCIQTPGGFDNYFQFIFPKRDGITWQAAARIFAPALVEQMYGGVKECLGNEKIKYPDDEYGVRHFIMLSRVRNRASANPLKVYANAVLPFTPGLTKGFLDEVISIPFHLKYNLDVYLKIFREQFREAMKVPWCSGGILINSNGKVNTIHKIYDYAEKLGLIESIKKHPMLESMARKFGKQPKISKENSLVNQTLALVDPGHPDLNGDGVRGLINGSIDADPINRSARAQLFYWQVWRWIMNGQLTMPRDFKTTSWSSTLGTG